MQPHPLPPTPPGRDVSFIRHLRTAAVLMLVSVPLALALVFAFTKQHYKHLPILGPRELGPTGDTLYHTLPGVGPLVDERGLPFLLDSLRGRIHVADFFFTTCPGICKKLTAALQEVQQEVEPAFRQVNDIRLVSYSIDPKNDSVPALQAYARAHHALPGLWRFVGGPQQVIFDLALKGYLLPTQYLQGTGDNGFTHSQMLVLVDPQLRIRGYYDALSAAELKRLKDEIKVLRLELNNAAKP